MKIEGFYFLKDQYFTDFPDKDLMRNHPKTATGDHHRPCFLCMRDGTHNDILWMIPISSKVNKYNAIRNRKIQRFGKCDTIVMKKVRGTSAVLLIQNMCPATTKYLLARYEVNGKPVDLTEQEKAEVLKKARKVLGLYEHGKKDLIFPDIEKIKKELLKQLEKEKS